MLTPITPVLSSRAIDQLAEGFPERGRAFWEAGLTRILAWPGNAGAEYPAGFLWLDKEEPVGILLTPASRRPGPSGQVLVNVSSWYIRPEYRWKAPLMLRALFRDPEAIFTDLTPTPDAQAMLQAFGFRQVNAGIALQVTLLLALKPGPPVKVRPWRPEDRLDSAAPAAEIIAFHRDRGYPTLVIEQGETCHLVICKPFLYRRLRAAAAVYISSHAAMGAALPALARQLLSSGILVLQSDIRPGKPKPLGFRKRGLWFAKGESFEDRTDHLGSELCLLDL